MQRNQVIFFLIIFPVLIGLACLQTTMPAATDELPSNSAATSTQISMRATVPGPEPAALIDADPTPTTPACAVINADEALHLRQGPDPQALVLAFMKSGEVVKLLSTKNPDWWLINRNGVTGYARSKYLESSDCQ